MVQFSADLDALSLLAQRMDGVASALHAEATDTSSSALGSGDAAGAFSDFVSGWSHGRADIVSGLGDAGSMLRGATANYQRTETALTSAYGAEEAEIGG